MIDQSKKTIFTILGFTFVILAIIGIFLPILPTTPFLILSAYLFSKSNERYHSWLLNHRIFGPIISDWEKYKVIKPKSKIIAVSMILILFSYTLFYVEVPIWIKVIVASSGLAVITFIVTRKSSKDL